LLSRRFGHLDWIAKTSAMTRVVAVGPHGGVVRDEDELGAILTRPSPPTRRSERTVPSRNEIDVEVGPDLGDGLSFRS